MLLIMDGLEGKTLQEVMRELKGVWNGLANLPAAGIEASILTPEEAPNYFTKGLASPS